MRDFWRAERLASSIGRDNDGVVDVTSARAAGLDDDARDALRRRGFLVRIANGVDRLRDHPFDFRCRCRAALAIAGPSAALGLRTAGRFHGCWAYRDCEEVEVVTLRGGDHRTATGRIVETRELPVEHVTEVDGFPVTTLARTFFDLCGDPDHGLPLRHPYHEKKMKQLYNDCLGRRGMTFAMAVAVLLVLAKRGRRGTRLVRSLLEHYGPKHTPTKSDVETLFLELVLDRGLPEPERQAVIAGPRGFIGTVDFAWREARHIVEVDSSWHDGPYDEEVDEQRDLDLIEAGYTISRYRYGHIVTESARLTRELAAILRPRGREIAARTGVSTGSARG